MSSPSGRPRRSHSSSPPLSDDDQEPSFSSVHFTTSTPIKARTSRLVPPGSVSSISHHGDESDEDGLRVSDTESLDLGAHLHLHEESNASQFNKTARLRLTRHSLSAVDNASASPNNPISSSRVVMNTPGGSTDRRTAYRDSPRYQRTTPRYAPSPSTGSSTLVERDDYDGLSARSAVAKGKQRATRQDDVRPPTAILEEGQDRPDDVEDSSSSSSSAGPSRRINGINSTAQLSSYIDAKARAARAPAATPKSAALRSSAPSTPLAPGAYPATTRKQPSTTLSRSLHSTPLPVPSSAAVTTTPPTGFEQVQAAFKRYITGPHGALTLSAERRAAAAANRTAVMATPHPAGHYAFSPQSAVAEGPERDERRQRERLPSSVDRNARFGNERAEAVEAEVVSDLDDEPSAAGAHESPSNRNRNRNGTRTARDEIDAGSKLERALRHIGRHHQREAELSYAGEDRGVNADAGEISVEQEEDEDEAGHAAGRSAIDFAMAKSFVAPASPPRQRTSPQAPPSPPSPSFSLPALPPAVSPEMSPARPRRQPAIGRRSPHSRQTSIITPPSSPPRGGELAPISSTPPRRTGAAGVALPAPLGTPLRALGRTSVAHPAELPHDEPVDDDDDAHLQSLPAIVAELATAVRALSSSSPRASARRTQADRHDAASTSASKSTQLASLLSRRKAESEARRAKLEDQMRKLEREGQGVEAARRDMVEKLMAADEVELSLGARVDQLREAFENLGASVGNQVVSAVQETLHDDARKRTSWLAWALCVQFVFFWLLMRFANARATAHLHDVYYYDPSFHLSSSASSSASSYYSPSLAPETLELFAQQLSPQSTPLMTSWWWSADARKWLERTARQAVQAGWGIERGGKLVGVVPS